MKYLYDHDDHVRHLRIWAGGMCLVRAHFYFWNPGQQMQKSLEGLLQTLLYHILKACPDLIPILCSGRWSALSQSDDNAQTASWTLTELRNAFKLFKAQPFVTTRFYFHIDGLDEYHGDCWEVIETLQDLSTTSNVKLCLSSRPWNEFQDAFGRSNPNMLQLHDLTREDIEMYARENLQSYIRPANFEPTLFAYLLRDIVTRAQGVFLWVRLAIRSLRDGITNEDPVSLLHERLRAIPLDLEEFFEQILASVEPIYRIRMANTFLATLRSGKPLRIMCYYFLEHDDPTCSFEQPAMRWSESTIQQRVLQTQRRLNGRFKGLLEPTSTVNTTSQTTVDFLHRTLRDFLIKGRMRKRLDGWAAQDTHVLISVSRALIAESKFIDEKPSSGQMKWAVELAHQASIETNSNSDYFEILDQVELEHERLNTSHLGCRAIGIMLRAAVSLGQIGYLRHRLAKHSAPTDFNHLLKHAITCPLDRRKTFAFCVQSAFGLPSTAEAQFKCFSQNNVPEPIYCSASSAMVKLLLDCGAESTATIEDTSMLHEFLVKLVDSMDGTDEEHVFEIFQTFLNKQVLDVNNNMALWHAMLVREGHMTQTASQNTLRYFKCLFGMGLDPNRKIDKDATVTTVFLRTLTDITARKIVAGHFSRNELLREFLRQGADITHVYKDSSKGGWLQSVCHELSHWPALKYGTSRIMELEIFLKHGLDLSSLLPDTTTTVWEHFLRALNLSLRQTPLEGEHQQLVCQTIILCLKHGANPLTQGLQETTDWLRGKDCKLTSSEAFEIRQALKCDDTDAIPKVHAQGPHRVQQCPPGEMIVTLRDNRDIPTSHESREDHKRTTTAPSDDIGHRRQVKRLRCG